MYSETTSESPTFQVSLVTMVLLLQVLDPLFQHLHELKCLSRHNGGSLESHLTCQETSIIILVANQPGLHEIGHLDLIVSVGKRAIPSPDWIPQPQVLPIQSYPGLGSTDHLGIQLKTSVSTKPKLSTSRRCT